MPKPLLSTPVAHPSRLRLLPVLFVLGMCIPLGGCPSPHGTDRDDGDRDGGTDVDKDIDEDIDEDRNDDRDGGAGDDDGGEPGARSSGLGTNLEGVEDYAAAYPFVDFFKQSRPWFAAAPGMFEVAGASLALDAQGWVRALPACGAAAFCFARTVFNSAEGSWPHGRYLVLYDGEGTITYGLGAARVPEESLPGRDVIEVDGGALWTLTIEATDPEGTGDHVRNIRVHPPGFDPDVAPVPTFHPDFLAELAPYRTVRFMDWMRTNGSGFFGAANTQRDFSDRALPEHAQWTRENGVPLEVMVELANTSGTEPWFTLPHRATDDYVDAFAALVLERLAPGRTVYVEHSNEVWNSAFPQGSEIEANGAALFGSAGDPFIRRLNAHGLRSAQMCKIWKDRFAADASRVVCVLGAQAANVFTQDEAAQCPLAVAAGLRPSPCASNLDAVAIAPYFGNYLDVPANEDEVETWSLDQLFTELVTGGVLEDIGAAETPCNAAGGVAVPCAVSALDEVTPWISGHAAAAASRNLRLLAYEGGQHLVGVFGVEENDAITDLFVAANRDARMGDAYARYLQSWRDGGGELFVHFTLTFQSGRFGSWGALEALAPMTRPPKARAIDAFNASNPCWWARCGS